MGLVMSVVAVVVLLAAGNEEARPTTVPAPSAVEVAAGAIEDVAFMAGDWRPVDERRGFHQEVWTAPAGKHVMGMFRWMKPDGTPMVMELLSISEEEGTLVFRMRHMTAKGVAWEEKDKPIEFRLTGKGANRAEFTATKDAGDLARYVYELRADGVMAIEVTFAPPTAEQVAAGKKARPPLKFEMKKV
jgi:hypothetical protein